MAAKVNRKASEVEAFAAANPAVFAWLETNTGFEFAVSLRAALEKYGSLTDGQLAAAQKCVASLAAAKEKNAARAVAAPAIDTAGVDRLKAAFDKATAYAREHGLTMKAPKITIGGMVISPAKATGKNPGAIYVKAGTTYLGKIDGGKFFAARECNEESEAKVMAFVAPPKPTAKPLAFAASATPP